MITEIGVYHTLEGMELAWCDGGTQVICPIHNLDLDKADRLSVTRDDVDFASALGVVGLEDDVALRSEMIAD